MSFKARPLSRMTVDKRELLDTTEYDAMVTPVVVSAFETLELPQTLMKSRSARRSRDLDINVQALLAPAPAPTPTPATNYNSLLLQDIQNFHEKKSSDANSNGNADAGSSNNNNDAVSSKTSNNINNTSNAPFTFPPCVSKACSILEAVADLNSTTNSNVSPLPFADDRRKTPRETNFSYNNGNKRAESKDPYIESEVNVGDDLMEPILHKYVTIRTKGVDFDDEESSGSNSFAGEHQQNWVSSSS